MVHFNLLICPLFPASESRGLIRLSFDPFGMMTGDASFHWEAHDVCFFQSFLTLAIVDPHCLNLLIH